jgi:hypothetical protein
VVEKPGQRGDDPDGERREGDCREREKLGEVDPVHGRHPTAAASTPVLPTFDGGRDRQRAVVVIPSAE